MGEAERVKLSGKAAQALWDAGRRDVAHWLMTGSAFGPLKARPSGASPPYTLATDEPLTTEQAIAVCGVSKLVEVKRGLTCELRYRMVGGEWQHTIEGGDWKPSEHPPGQSLCKAWRLVAGDVTAWHLVAADLREEFPTVGKIMAAAKRGLASFSEAGSLARDGAPVDLGMREEEYPFGEPDMPHRTDSLAEAGRHAEGEGVVEDDNGDLYRDDAEPEPQVKPKRGAELRRWAIDHASRVVLVNGRHRQRWHEEAARFEVFDDDGWEQCDIGDHDEGVPESGTWEG